MRGFEKQTGVYALVGEACLLAEDKTSSALCRRACPLANEIWNAFWQAGVWEGASFCCSEIAEKDS